MISISVFFCFPSSSFSSFLAPFFLCFGRVLSGLVVVFLSAAAAAAATASLPPPLHWVCWVQQCVVLSALRSETNEFRSGCYHSRHRCCATTASNGNLEDGDDIALYEPTIHQQPAETHFILLIQKLILISYRAYASSCSLSDWIICNQSRNDLDESFILLGTECNYW